jgi:two-component system LytT family sensor kinase
MGAKILRLRSLPPLVIVPSIMPGTPRRSPFPLSPAAIFGLWTIPTLLSTLETVMFARLGGRPIAVWRAFLAEAPQWYGWAALMPLIILLGDRFPLRRPLRARNVLAHIVASLSCGYLIAMGDAAVNMVLRPSRATFFASTRSWFIGGLPATTVAYFAIVVLAYAIANAARLRESETQLRDAQLSALRMQLQPHFLFNSLNAIMALVRDRETEQAVRALSLLSDVLRTAVNTVDSHTTTLRDELEFVSRYLDIERVRFGDRLRVGVDVPDDLLGARVPTFVLQPFVENALKHGILRDRGGNEISISARDGTGALTLTIRDDGRGLSNEQTGGVGIANARARLEHLYGSDASLSVRDASPGVEVVIRIPR